MKAQSRDALSALDTQKAVPLAFGMWGETPQLARVLIGLWLFYLSRGELWTARGLAEQFLSLAERQRTPGHFVCAHMALSNTLLRLGDVAASHAYAEQGLALYHSAQFHVVRPLIGTEPGVSCWSILAWTLWLLGHPGQAAEASAAMVTLARELADPFGLGFALLNSAMIHGLRREWLAVRERVEAVLALAVEHGFSLLPAMATIYRGRALAVHGQTQVGMTQIHQGMTVLEAMGIALLRPFHLALLAETYSDMAQPEKGLQVLDEALALVDYTGERWWETEVYRLKGELLQSAACSMRPAAWTPGMCFQKALDISRRQQARSLELRVAMSLSRLWQQRGKSDQARQLLAEVYNGFTEGFDTVDLQEAKPLLDRLTA